MAELAPGHPLAPFEAKLKRANESLHTFDREYLRFAKRNPLQVDVKVDFQSGWHIAYIDHAEPVPLTFAVLIGESLYHARSALEHLVWAMVKANHKKPGHHNTFPLFAERPKAGFMVVTNRPREGKTAPGALRGVPKQARALIESLQPYHAPMPSLHFLAVLNRMARDDRHHALHSDWIGGASGDFREILRAPRGVEITAYAPLLESGRRLVAGTKLARFRTNPLSRRPKVYMQGDLPAFAAFGDRKTGLIRFGDFHEINKTVAKVVSMFEEFL